VRATLLAICVAISAAFFVALLVAKIAGGERGRSASPSASPASRTVKASQTWKPRGEDVSNNGAALFSQRGMRGEFGDEQATDEIAVAKLPEWRVFRARQMHTALLFESAVKTTLGIGSEDDPYGKCVRALKTRPPKLVLSASVDIGPDGFASVVGWACEDVSAASRAVCQCVVERLPTELEIHVDTMQEAVSPYKGTFLLALQ